MGARASRPAMVAGQGVVARPGGHASPSPAMRVRSRRDRRRRLEQASRRDCPRSLGRSQPARSGARRSGAADRQLTALAERIVVCRHCARLVRHREASAAARPCSTAVIPTGRGRSPGSATRVRDPPGRPRPRRHGGTGPGACSRRPKRGLGCSARCGGRPASQPTSSHRTTVLALRGAYIPAHRALRAARNRPTPAEIERCRPYLLAELAVLSRIRVVVALGRIGWDAYLRARRASASACRLPLPRFGTGAHAVMPYGLTLLRQLPTEPAEHLHRPPHPAHAARRPRPGPPPRRAPPVSRLAWVPARSSPVIPLRLQVMGPRKTRACSFPPQSSTQEAKTSPCGGSCTGSTVGSQGRLPLRARGAARRSRRQGRPVAAGTVVGWIACHRRPVLVGRPSRSMLGQG